MRPRLVTATTSVISTDTHSSAPWRSSVVDGSRQVFLAPAKDCKAQADQSCGDRLSHSLRTSFPPQLQRPGRVVKKLEEVCMAKRRLIGMLTLAAAFAAGCSGGSSTNSVQQTNMPLVTAAAAARFLEQSTFGPNSTLIAQVQQTGFPAFLSSQFTAPSSTYADPPTGVNSLLSTQETLFTNALSGQDQLRQRVALALSEIWVTSGFTVPPQGMAPYMRLLLQDAFGNYRTLMFDVTLSPAMGRYLDMVNNDKPVAPATHANENYARELMQLFTLGLDQLNEDGTLKLDSSNNPIPTYSQNDVEAF